MEHIATFVLGIIMGLLLLSVIGSTIMMFRISKKVANLEMGNQTLHGLIDHVEIQTNRSLDERIDELHRRIDEYIQDHDRETDELHRKLDERFDVTHRKIDDDFQQMMKRTDEINRYADSRFDKTIEMLCTRMDIMFVKKEEQEQILKS